MTVPTPRQQLATVRCDADRTLSLLLLLHFPAAVALAVLHGTWIAALLLGGGVSGGAYLLARRAPGAFSTRVLIALGFVAYGALLVDEAHGLIEVHFYFFAALAFLLVYRDWRLTVVAAGAIAVHHLGFTVLQAAGVPVWVMPDGHLGLGMVLLHAVFVVFESGVLIVLARSMEADTLSSLVVQFSVTA
jgi:methyl-accepting chemotaxis protein